jgi:RNA-directed DNA polymerase
MCYVKPMQRYAKQDRLDVSEQQLEIAYQWLCKRRLHFPHNADIWSLRFNWHRTKVSLLQQIRRGDYVFSPLKRLHKENGTVIHLWCAQDALVLKVMAGLLQDTLILSTHCTHVKGHGGLKQCVVKVQQQLKKHSFVCKTDVKHYYQSIDQSLLLEQLYSQVKNKVLRRYLYQVIRRTVEEGGNYHDIKLGIARGCPISPILGALYLKALDDAFDKQGLHYSRYMDDILILTKTRWHNRKSVKLLNHVFNQLNVEQHPDKTFIGKIAKGFDFLGYHFSTTQLHLASITIRKHVDRMNQLYVPAGGIPNLAKC